MIANDELSTGVALNAMDAITLLTSTWLPGTRGYLLEITTGLRRQRGRRLPCGCPSAGDLGGFDAARWAFTGASGRKLGRRYAAPSRSEAADADIVRTPVTDPQTSGGLAVPARTASTCSPRSRAQAASILRR